jgi:hypothetical protein
MLKIDRGKYDEKLRKVNVTLYVYKKQNVRALIGELFENSVQNVLIALCVLLRWVHQGDFGALELCYFFRSFGANREIWHYYQLHLYAQ